MSMKHPQSVRQLVSPHDREERAAPRHTMSVGEPLVSVSVVAERLQVHPRTVHRWTRNRLIPFYRVGKSVRYRLNEVLASVSFNDR